jgi:hypothetical protein
VSDGKRTWIARSFGKLLKLFEVKERLHARSATIHHLAHLGAVLCPSSQEKRGPSARLPPHSHPRQGGLREVSASLGVRMRLLWRIADDECSATTLRRKRDEWIEAGTMDILEQIVKDTYDRTIGLELSDIAVDCCITKAPCGGERSGTSPVDRGKGGIKRSVAVDADGIPLGSVGAPANRHDSPLLPGTLDSVEEILGALPEPARVHLDRGYDSDLTRKRLAQRDLIGVISEKGKPSRFGPQTVGWWSAPTPGKTPTRSWCGAPRGKGGL